MEQLNEIQKEFEQIKTAEESEEIKSRKYAGLMTRLEQAYNISQIQTDNAGVPARVMELYLQISNARTF